MKKIFRSKFITKRTVFGSFLFLQCACLSFLLYIFLFIWNWRYFSNVLRRFILQERFRAKAFFQADLDPFFLYSFPDAPALRQDRSVKHVRTMDLTILLLYMVLIAVNCVNLLLLVDLFHFVFFYSADLISSIFYLIFALVIYAAEAVIFSKLVRGISTDMPNYEADILRLHQSRREIVEAFEIERRRIERDLHDGAQQYLVAASMKVGEAAMMLELESYQSEKISQAKQLLEEAQTVTEQALKALRSTVNGVHPKILSDRGLAEAIRDVCKQFPLKISLQIPYELPKLPEGIAASGYYMVSESLTNVAKYAPRAEVSILVVAGEELVIKVIDSGPGGACLVSGRGLSGLSNRLQAVGGELYVHSPLGGPTTVRASIPLLVETPEIKD